MNLFHVPRTLDEIGTAAVFVAWPFVYSLILRPVDVPAAADVACFAVAAGIQVGIAVAMKNARNHAP